MAELDVVSCPRRSGAHEIVVGVEIVEVGTSSHCLRLSREPGSQDYLSAELCLPGLSARTDVYEFNGFGGLADFFSGMVADWRGWQGVRECESLEGDMRIEATHDGGHIQLRVTLRRDTPSGWHGERWVTTADLVLELGEQLRGIADELRDLVA